MDAIDQLISFNRTTGLLQSVAARNAWDQEIDAPALPTTMDEAISVFDKSDVLSSYLTSEFKTLFLATKVQERNEFAKRVTEFELETYLRI